MITQDEHKVINHLVDAWNAFLKLPVDHPDSVPDFRHAIHAAQREILSRVGRREMNQ